MEPSTLAIDIDLGTLYSCVSIWQQNRVEIISNHDGNKVTPCCVAFTSTGRLIGDAAKNQIVVNPQNTIFGIKSLMGRRFDDPKVIQDAKYRSFYVVNDYGRPKIQVDWKGETIYFSPEEISAMVLIKLKNIAENYLGTSVKNAVITVPAYFNNSQRQATKDAATIAGLNVLRIISEPTATALAYRLLNKNVKEQKNVLIFDLGGETTEVSIVSINGGSLEIKAIAYDQAFGGKDFDNRLVKHLSNEFKRRFKIDLNPYSVYRLQSAAQQAKHTLSSSKEVEVKINALVDDIDFCTQVSRGKFEEVCSDLFSKTLCPVKKALNDAKLAPPCIDDIVLVGGSTRIPKIQYLLQNFFPGKSLNFPTNPEETIAYGAAILAAVLSGDKSVDLHIPFGPMSLADVTPFSLGIETAGGEISKIINQNTKIPCKQTRTFTTYTDNQCAITIKVYEGERAVSTKNDLLCTFELTEIPPAPFGIPKIDVTFSLDANGILEVTAKENSFQVSKTIVIQNNKGLSREEINRMVAYEVERSKEEYFAIGLQKNIQKGTKRKISQ